LPKAGTTRIKTSVIKKRPQNARSLFDFLDV
jgi:hypothetical protein